nr:hypothetical protein [Burkholderiaceae bacterium]
VSTIAVREQKCDDHNGRLALGTSESMNPPNSHFSIGCGNSCQEINAITMQKFWMPMNRLKW